MVSVGETRRFCFRPTPAPAAHHESDGVGITNVLKVGALSLARDDAASGAVHLYTVFDGDVVHMFGDCQRAYQHTVRQAERPRAQRRAARARHSCSSAP